MKKISYFCLTLLMGLGLAGCSDNPYDSWADPLSSNTEQAVTIDGLTAHSTGTIDLNRTGSSVALCVLPVDSMPVGYSFSNIKVTLTPVSDGAISTDAQDVYLDANCMIDSASVQSAVVAAYGQAPTVRQFSGHVTPTLTNGSSTVLVDAGTVDVYITPAYEAAPLYWIVGLNGWNATAAQASVFYPSKDNPTTQFSYTAVWPSQWALKIWATDNIGSWDNAWGTEVDGATDESGTLYDNVNGGQANSFGAPNTTDYYTLNIDMANHTYTWTRLDDQNPTVYDNISLIGNFNDWGGDADLQHASDGNVHNWYAHGVVLKAGDFKFRANHGWDIAWGSNSNDPEYYSGVSGSLTAYGEGRIGGSNGNLTVPADGTYSVYFNDITGQFVLVPEL